MATSKKGTGTNLDKLRQVFNESNTGGGGSYNWWRPNWGDNVVRVLPAIDPDDVFFLETARHRINGEWFYCLKFQPDPETGRPQKCPICEARTRLFRSGDADLIKIAKDIKPKKQYLMNLVDRKDEDETKVHVFASGVKIWNKMVTTMLDDDIDITDVEEGYDFLIKKEEGPKTENGQFPSYDNSKAKRKATPLHEDPKVAKQILENRVELSEVPRFDEPAVLQGAVDAYIQSLTDPTSNEEFYDDDSSKQEAATETAPKPATSKKSSSGGSNIKDFKAKLAQQLRQTDEDDEDEDE